MLTAYAQNAASDVAGETASELANLIELVITKIPLWIAAFIVILISVIVAKIARRMVENKLAQSGIEEEHKELQILGGRLTYTGILVLGITVGLKIAGIDLTTIIAAGAFGIGFALKDLIMNFLAGMMILISRHFTIGDFINIGGTIGRVTEIQSRVTILQATDGTKVIVPNADIFKKQVTSFTSNPFRRIELLVNVGYDYNLENALKVCMHAAKATKGVLAEPHPAVLVSEFGDAGVEIKIRVWVESKGGWLKIKSELAQNVTAAFSEYGIDMPWSTMTIGFEKDLVNEEKMFKGPEPQVSPQQPQAPLRQLSTQAAAQPQATNTPALAEQEIEIERPLKPLGEQ
ncbi:MAG: mechanosensitive ion channel [Candidatus Peregrinibacteria bacterium]